MQFLYALAVWTGGGPVVGMLGFEEPSSLNSKIMWELMTLSLQPVVHSSSAVFAQAGTF